MGRILARVSSQRQQKERLRAETRFPSNRTLCSVPGRGTP